MAKIKQIKAFSILESAIAITVITVCLTIATVVFTNVLSSSTGLADLHLEQTADSLFYATKTNKKFIDLNISTIHGRVDQKVELQNKNGLYKITITSTSKRNKREKYTYLLNE